MIEAALATYLKSRTAVSDIVGTRVGEGLAAQAATRPFLSYELDGGQRFYHSTGASGLVSQRITLKFEGTTYGEARTLYDAVRDEIDGFQGTWDGISIDSAFLDVPRRSTSQPVSGKEQGLPSVSATLDVTYRETVPSLGGA